MTKKLLNNCLPHIIAVLVFLLVAAVYCKPVFENKVLFQEDVLQWQGMAQNSFKYQETHGHLPLWSNGMFSGMPAYQIALDTQAIDTPSKLYDLLTLYLKKPVSFFFLACLCFYFLTQVLRINPYIGIIGGLAYAYATYNPVIISVGHDTKMQAIALLPAFIGSLMLIYEKKYWLGAALTTLFTALFVSTNHMQIVYYGLITAMVMTTGYAIRWVRQKDFKHLIRSGSIALAAGIVGVLCNAVTIFTTYDSSKETIRGGSELADTRSNYTDNGLSETSAFDFSYYKSEPFVMLVPQMFGGSTGDEVSIEDSKAARALSQMPPQLASQFKDGLRFYWGGVNSLVSGPPYAGAIICFLTILGLFLLDNKHKWWILATCVLTILMSWGGYFQEFNSLLLKFLPMYNKFRAPSMIMVVPVFLLCIQASLTLQKIITPGTNAAFRKKYLQGLFLTAVIFGLLYLFYIRLDYTSNMDKQLLEQAAARGIEATNYVQAFVNGLKEDRQALFSGSLLRSLLFILAAAIVIGLQAKNWIRPGFVLGILGVLTFADVMGMDIKYLNSDNYKQETDYQKNFAATPADSEILRDKSYYRVFDLRDGASATLSYGAMTAWFHHSIGGYHAAKLKIYEDLIDHQLNNYPECQPVINMLNTKYIIRPLASGADTVYTNPDALGAAWFVHAVRFENTPRKVMNALSSLHAKDTAIVFDADHKQVRYNQTADSTASIQLVKNDNDVITYRSVSGSPRFAVFSEIFYKRGWRAWVDDTETPIVRTNYVLRGLSVPAGHHMIRFVFHPQSYYIGRQLQWMANIILILLIVAAVIVSFQEGPLSVLPYKIGRRLGSFRTGIPVHQLATNKKDTGQF
jgi:hypothetical protein